MQPGHGVVHVKKHQVSVQHAHPQRARIEQTTKHLRVKTVPPCVQLVTKAISTTVVQAHSLTGFLPRAPSHGAARQAETLIEKEH